MNLKKSGPGVTRAAKGFTLFILSEIMDDISKKEDSDLSFDGATETIKHQKKNKNVDLLVLRWRLWLLH